MERLEKYDVYDVEIARIYESDFNCRMAFTPQSVKGLADDIADVGLEFPVVLQRCSDMQSPPAGYDFRLVAGHRRLMAVRMYLNWTTIPANIRTLTDRQAEILNLTENLEREDLNPLEQALAIVRRFPEGTPLRQIGRELKRDGRWVSQRLKVTTLSEDLQMKVAAKMLTLLDVEMLVKMSPEEQMVAADELIAARGRNKRKLRVNPAFRRKFRGVRGKTEVNARIGQLLELGLEGLATRFGAWFAGYISDDEFDADIDLAVLEKLESKSGSRVTS